MCVQYSIGYFKCLALRINATQKVTACSSWFLAIKGLFGDINRMEYSAQVPQHKVSISRSGMSDTLTYKIPVP